MKKALITGVTGQDGAYLTQFLLEKGYEVHGLKRRSSVSNIGRIEAFIDNPNFHIHEGDLIDTSSILRLVSIIRPDEIYNLGAMSDVKVSFDAPEYVANVDGLGTIRILEAIRSLGLEKKTKFYQASTSELYGMVQEIPQTEKTPFYPRSPYGVAKLYSFWSVVNYREAYGIFASNGILFNHESPLRGETFVTRKITKTAAEIACGREKPLSLGNLDAKRDWGFAKEYVEGMWLMLQQEKPEDFVLATGVTTTVRDFATWSFRNVGIELEWSGKSGSVDEVGKCSKTGRVVVKVDPKYFRPTEVDILIGNAQKAKTKLGWVPKVNVEELCRIMVEADLENTKKRLKEVHEAGANGASTWVEGTSGFGDYQRAGSSGL